MKIFAIITVLTWSLSGFADSDAIGDRIADSGNRIVDGITSPSCSRSQLDKLNQQILAVCSQQSEAFATENDVNCMITDDSYSSCEILCRAANQEKFAKLKLSFDSTCKATKYRKTKVKFY